LSPVILVNLKKLKDNEMLKKIKEKDFEIREKLDENKAQQSDSIN
jgi:formiminotetrahydrofolate cyclodeaminase